MNESGDHPGPTGLMACPYPGAVVAVEVLVEQQIVSPQRIGLELLGFPEHGAPTVGPESEDTLEPARDLAGDLEQGHHPARAGGALDAEVVAVVCIEVRQRADDQHVY